MSKPGVEDLGPVYGVDPSWGGHGYVSSRNARGVTLRQQRRQPDFQSIAVEVELLSEFVTEASRQRRALYHYFRTVPVTHSEPPTYPMDLRAERWTAPLPIDGEPHEFTFIGDSNFWRASLILGGREVEVTAFNVRADDVGLVSTHLPRPAST